MELLERLKSLYLRWATFGSDIRRQEVIQLQTLLQMGEQGLETKILWQLLLAREVLDTPHQDQVCGFLDRAMELAEQMHPSYWMSEIHRLRARLLSSEGRSEQAFELLVRASAEAQSAENFWTLALTTYSLGVISANSGDYDGASVYLTRCLELTSHANADPSMQAHAHLVLAQAQLERGAKQEALYHATKSYEGYRELGNIGRVTVAASLLVSVNIELKEIEAARVVLSTINFESAAPVQLVSLLNLRAKLHSLAGEFRNAHQDHDAAIALAKEIGVQRLTTNSIQLKCETLLLEERAEDALQLLERIALESAAGYDLLSLHELRGKALEQLSQFKEAFEEVKQFAILQRELLSERATNALSRLRTAQEVLQAEREAAHFRERSQFYAKELSQRTSYLVQQNQHVNEVIDHIQAMSRQRPDVASLFKEINKRLRELPGASFNWEEYLRLFDEIHPKALANLSERYPELSSIESKICSLILAKCSNLEIGRLLGLSERSVESHRTRLRRKLGLAAGADLTGFLERTIAAGPVSTELQTVQ